MKIHIPADFTLAELRAFIAGEADEAPMEGYYTAREWAKHLGINVGLMRELLNEAKGQGLLQKAGAKRETLDGRPYTAIVYALQGKSEDGDDTS